MKRLLEFPTLLALGILSLLGMQEASAACVNETGPGQVNAANPLYQARFGAWVNAYAKTSGDAGVNCETYRTVIDDYPTKLLTAETSEATSTHQADEKVYNAGTANEYTLDMQADSSATASISSGSVTSTVRRYNATAYIDSDAEWIDLVKIENLNAGLSDVNYIPVTFCSELTSEFTTNGPDATTLSYGDFHTYGPAGFDHKGADSLTITGGNTISNPSTGKICRTGEIKMTGQYVYFSLKLKTYALGNYGTETVPTFGTYTTNIPIYDASVTASFDMGALPDGATCESASGVFPGCDRNVCSSIDDPVADLEAPEVDYSDTIFSLTRQYKDTGVCVPSGCGVNWHGNYGRAAEFLLTSESHTVEVTDSESIPSLFREKTAGVWENVNKGVETFEEVLDGSQVLIGYLYTDRSGVKDTYDLNGVLTKIEKPAGDVLNLTYDTSGRLSAVTEPVSGDNLTFTYNSSDQVTLVTAPSDTISYTYDANDNLATATTASGTRTYHYTDPLNLNDWTGTTDESGVFAETISNRTVPGLPARQWKRLKDLMLKLNPDIEPLPSYEPPTFNWIDFQPSGGGVVYGQVVYDSNIDDYVAANPVGSIDFEVDATGMEFNDDYIANDMLCTHAKGELFDFYNTLLHEHLHYTYGPNIKDSKYDDLRDSHSISEYDFKRHGILEFNDTEGGLKEGTSDHDFPSVRQEVKVRMDKPLNLNKAAAASTWNSTHSNKVKDEQEYYIDKLFCSCAAAGGCNQ